jgi:outer membrane protein TolC
MGECLTSIYFAIYLSIFGSFGETDIYVTIGVSVGRVLKAYMICLFAMEIPLHSMSLQECIGYARKHAIVLEKGRNELKLSALSVESASLERYGELNLVADYNHYNTPRTLAPLTPTVMQSGIPIAESKNIFSVGFSYTLPIFTGFAQMRKMEMEGLSSKIAGMKLHLIEEELIYNVRSLYLSGLMQMEMLEGQKRYTTALEKLVSTIEEDVKLGKKAEIDLLKARNDLQNSRTMEITFESNILSLRAALEALIGKDPGRFEKVDVSPEKPSALVNMERDRISSLEKIDIESMAVQKAEKMVHRSEASKLPQVDLTLYAGKNYGRDTAHSLGIENEDIYDIHLHARWNLFDFGKRDIAVQKARIAVMQSRLKREERIDSVRKMLKSAYASLKASYASYKGTLSKLGLSEKTERIEAVRYDSGVSTIDDLLLAKARTQMDRAKMIESRYGYLKSLYYIDYILEKGRR